MKVGVIGGGAWGTALAQVAAQGGETWLWADDRHLSAGGQRALGSLAQTRAANNPF